MSMKNPLTPTGIEPATIRFVAHHLNHRATAVPKFGKGAAELAQNFDKVLYLVHSRALMTGFY